MGNYPDGAIPHLEQGVEDVVRGWKAGSHLVIQRAQIQLFEVIGEGERLRGQLNMSAIE